MENKNETVDQNVFEEVLEQDSQAIEAFLEKIYSKSVPPPQTPTKNDLNFWKIAGLESSLFVLSAIGAAILSAVRTGGLFFVIEVKLIEKFLLPASLGNIFGFASMGAALLAFEGFILAFGLNAGKQSNRMKVSGIGLGISLITIAAAGLFSSFSIVAIDSSTELTMDIALALITGVASALVAFYSSENLGFIFNHVITRRNQILEEHQQAFRKWRDQGVNSYIRSHYNFRNKRSQQVYGDRFQYFGNEVKKETHPSPIQNFEHKRKQNDIIKEWIGKHIQEKGKWPTQAEVQNAVGGSPTNAYYGMLSFVYENEDYLRENFIVDETKMEDYIKSYRKWKKIE